jgi:hypothetical protein
MSRFALLIALVALGGTANSFAQAPVPIGTVVSIDGLVTMGIGSEVLTVQANTPVYDGARFVSGSGGQLQLQLPGNCTVNVGPNQFVAIDSSLSCVAQQNAVQNLSALAGGGSGSLGSSTFLQTLLPLAGAAALAAAAAKFKDEAITPRPQ